MDKDKIKKHFSKSALTYDQFGRLQRWMGLEIIRRIPSRFKPGKILDLGCGTGWLDYKLAKKYPASKILALDIAPGMISFAKQKRSLKNISYQCRDAESLSLPQKSVDLEVSNATLQWTDFGKVAKRVFTVLQDKGLFLFTTFGPQTLKELRSVFTKDKKNIPVHDFLASAVIKKLLRSAGFQNVRIKKILVKKKYHSIKNLMGELKGLGALSAKENSDTSLRRGKDLLRVIERNTKQKGFVVTYEVLIGAAKK